MATTFEESSKEILEAKVGAENAAKASLEPTNMEILGKIREENEKFLLQVKLERAAMEEAAQRIILGGHSLAGKQEKAKTQEEKDEEEAIKRVRSFL